jgi:NAD(P)-dependent dehydrogenase (short-subunit alcohol dehydrogenase family)
VTLEGRRALVTGAGMGIGQGIALELARQGADVAVHYAHSRDGADETAAEIRKLGRTGAVLHGDLAVVADCRRVVDAAAEALGGLDVVVANAGIATGGPLRVQDLRSWERVIEINLLGVMYTDRAALPHLEQSRGYLLNIASTAAALRGPGMTAYCAAKAGVEALTDCLRIEMQPFGVAVGVAYFLFLDTDMVNDSEREMPMLRRAKAEMPQFLARTYPLPPAIDEVVAAIGERRRRVAYPRWFLKALAVRQFFASPIAERQSQKTMPDAMREYEQMVAERGATAASATERTRELAGL